MYHKYGFTVHNASCIFYPFSKPIKRLVVSSYLVIHIVKIVKSNDLSESDVLGVLNEEAEFNSQSSENIENIETSKT